MASRRMCHLLDFERLGRPLTGDSLLPFQLFWEQIRLRQFRRALSYERKDRPELRPDVVPLPRRHSLILGRRVTFTFAVAKFSGARLRRVTPPENFPLRLRLSTLTGSSKVGRDAEFEFPTPHVLLYQQELARKTISQAVIEGRERRSWLRHQVFPGHRSLGFVPSTEQMRQE